MNVVEDAICPTCGGPSTWNHPSVYKSGGVERPWPKGRYIPAGPAYCSIECREAAGKRP